MQAAAHGRAERMRGRKITAPFLLRAPRRRPGHIALRHENFSATGFPIRAPDFA